ncbi:hypothetical protein HI914_04407 [Erysiphe necator]|nr:hypothetical protein HI914_04407 [Erysiphe necator]
MEGRVEGHRNNAKIWGGGEGHFVDVRAYQIPDSFRGNFDTPTSIGQVHTWSYITADMTCEKTR